MSYNNYSVMECLEFVMPWFFFLHVPHVHSRARSIGVWFLCFGLTNRSELCEESRSTNLNTLQASQPQSYITGLCLLITYHTKWQAKKQLIVGQAVAGEDKSVHISHHLLWTKRGSASNATNIHYFTCVFSKEEKRGFAPFFLFHH